MVSTRKKKKIKKDFQAVRLLLELRAGGKQNNCSVVPIPTLPLAHKTQQLGIQLVHKTPGLVSSPAPFPNNCTVDSQNTAVGRRKPPARRRVYRGIPRETADDVPIQARESTPIRTIVLSRPDAYIAVSVYAYVFPYELLLPGPNPNNYTVPEGPTRGGPVCHRRRAAANPQKP